MNLTDEEIIRALECCTETGIGVCSECRLRNSEGICTTLLARLSLNLINRQKAEIDRYKCVIKILENDVKAAKSEAYKEFAERLLELCSKDLTISNDSYSLIEENIKIIQKEMVGEE